MAAHFDPTEQLVVEMFVRDLTRSQAFYAALGFEVVLEKPGFAAMAWEGHQLFLDEHRDLQPASAASMPNVRILVPDVDAFWARARDLGARILAPIADRDYGLRDFTLADPDGLGLRFATPLGRLRPSTLDASGADAPDLRSLASAPQQVAAMLSGLSVADLRWHPAGAEWSVRGFHVGWSLAQHVCHLRDLEREGYGIRIARLDEEEAPFFPDVDGEKLAAERDYDRQDVRRAVADFAAARAANLVRVRSAAGLGRGRLEGVGEVTRNELLDLVRHHDEGHLETMRRMADAVRARHGRPD